MQQDEKWPMGKIGKTYAYGLNVWSQLAVFLSVANVLGIAALVYKNFFEAWLPLWGFTGLIVIGVILLVIFVIKVGIPAYYLLTRNLTGINRIEKAVNKENK